MAVADVIEAEVPASTPFGRIKAVDKNRVQREWMGYEEAAERMEISSEEAVRMIREGKITGKIRQGRLYVLRKDVEQYRKEKFFNSENLEYVMGKGRRLYTPSRHKSGRRKILINITRYSQDKFGCEISDVAAAFGKSVAVIRSIAEKNHLVTETIGDKCYISVWSFWEFLEENQKKPG